jgi:hypothetical protein
MGLVFLLSFLCEAVVLDVAEVSARELMPD